MTVITVPDTVPDLLGTSPADLVAVVREYVVAPLHEARQRAERIRAGLASYTQMRQDIADAYARRDWEALDYPTWASYVEGEFGTELRALTRDERPAAALDMHERGMSQRAIADALGVGVGTVNRDLTGVPNGTPDATVTGRDGKTYPAARPETPARQESEPISPGLGVATTGGPDRPKPPTWDPDERRQHEEDVRRRQDIDAAHRTAQTIVTEVRSLVQTIVAGSRYGERGLVSPDMIRDLRAAIDLLEGEL